MIKFDFKENYILEDDFIKLSPLKIEHTAVLLDIANQTDIWKYSFSKGDGIENLTNYIQSTIDNRKAEKEYPFIVFDKTLNKYAGSTRLYDVIPSLESLRVGYTWYGKEHRGTGLNKHCKYLLFDFVFEQMEMNRIGLGAYIDNTISIKAMESIGCTKEGVFREFLPSPNGIGKTDAILLSILKSEWIKNKRTELKNKLKNPVHKTVYSK